jgi:hypothetical protein
MAEVIRGISRRVWIAFVCACGLAAGAGAASAQTPPAAPPAVARLGGVWVLTGRVTVASNVPGEHVGQRVTRRWTFTPMCSAAGPCSAITLVRTRASGADELVLHQVAPGNYAGTGSFSAPLRCGGHVYPSGELVPFTITVRITNATYLFGVAVATQLSATYKNTSRVNLTRCVGVLGHDSATYQSQLGSAQPARATAAGVSGRSPAGT